MKIISISVVKVTPKSVWIHGLGDDNNIYSWTNAKWKIQK